METSLFLNLFVQDNSINLDGEITPYFPLNRKSLNCVPRSPRVASMWMSTLLKDRT